MLTLNLPNFIMEREREAINQWIPVCFQKFNLSKACEVAFVSSLSINTNFLSSNISRLKVSRYQLRQSSNVFYKNSLSPSMPTYWRKQNYDI